MKLFSNKIIVYVLKFIVILIFIDKSHSCSVGFYGDDCTCTSDVASLMSLISSTSPAIPPPTDYTCTNGTWTIPGFHLTVSWDVKLDHIIIQGNLRVNNGNISFLVNPNNLSDYGQMMVNGGITFDSTTTSGAGLILNFPTNFTANSPNYFKQYVQLISLTGYYSPRNKWENRCDCYFTARSCYSIFSQFSGNGFEVTYSKDPYCVTENSWSSPIQTAVQRDNYLFEMFHDGTNWIRSEKYSDRQACGTSVQQQNIFVSSSPDLQTWTSPIRVLSDCTYIGIHKVAVNNAGHVMVSWANGNTRVFLSVDHGSTFTNTATIPDPSPSLSPRNCYLSFQESLSSWIYLCAYENFIVTMSSSDGISWTKNLCSVDTGCISLSSTTIYFGYSTEFLSHSSKPNIYFSFLDGSSLYVMTSTNLGKNWALNLVNTTTGFNWYTPTPGNPTLFMVHETPYIIWEVTIYSSFSFYGLGWQQLSDVDISTTNNADNNLLIGSHKLRFGHKISLHSGIKSFNDTILIAYIENPFWVVVQGYWSNGELQFTIGHFLPFLEISVGDFSINPITGQWVLMWEKANDYDNLYFSMSSAENWQELPILRDPIVTNSELESQQHATRGGMIALYSVTCFIWIFVAANLYFCTIHGKCC